MKPTVTILFSLALTILIVGCGTSEENFTETTKAESSTQIIWEQSFCTDQFHANPNDTVAIDTDTNAEISANTDTDNDFVNSTVSTSDRETISEIYTSNHSQTTTDTVTQATDTDVSMNDDEWVEVECTHHDTAGDILVRTVTWSENESGRVWTCTQCGASAKDGESAKGTVRVKKSSLTKPSDSSPQDPSVCNHDRLMDGMWVDAYEYTGEDEGYDIYTCIRCGTTKRIKQEPQVQHGPYDVVAKEGTEELLAERMLYYINQYRAEEGNFIATVLPGLTEACKRRSVQLVDNFAHDRDASVDIVTEMQYGPYIDPHLWGDDGDPYYELIGQEAIGECGMFSPITVDALAKKMVDAFRESKGHWDYVGASISTYRSYKYIGIGVTYDKGGCYTCIWVSDTDKYDK